MCQITNSRGRKPLQSSQKFENLSVSRLSSLAKCMYTVAVQGIHYKEPLSILYVYVPVPLVGAEGRWGRKEGGWHEAHETNFSCSPGRILLAPYLLNLAYSFKRLNHCTVGQCVFVSPFKHNNIRPIGNLTRCSANIAYCKRHCNIANRKCRRHFRLM